MTDVLEAVPPSASTTKLEPMTFDAGDMGEAPRPIGDPVGPEVPAAAHTGGDPEAAQRLHEQRVVAELRKTLEGMPPEQTAAAAAAMGGAAASRGSAEFIPSKLEIQNPQQPMPTTRFERALHGGKSVLKPLLLAGGAAIALLFMIISSAAKGASGGGGRGGH